MDSFKLENFYKEHKKKIEFWTICDEISAFIKFQLLSELNIKSKFDNNFNGIYNSLEKVNFIEDINGGLGFENILAFLSELSLKEDCQFFVIWDFDRKVDIFSVNTLKEYWSDIWYADSDESVMLYIPNKVFILITDWGELKIKNLVV